MIFALLRGCITFMLFMDFMERRFPNEFGSFVLSSSLYFIQFYSKIQIQIDRFLRNHPELKEKITNLLNVMVRKQRPSEDILYVKNAKVLTASAVDNYDFKITTHSGLLKKVQYREQNQEQYANIDECSFRLLLLEFCYENSNYKINLQSEEYNYYLVGNRFTKDFFFFYLNHYYQKNLQPDTIDKDVKCGIIMIDQNVDRLEFDFTDKNETIVLLKNGYNIDKTK